MAAKMDSTAEEINWDNYQIDRIPAVGSALVLRERKQMLGIVQFNDFVEDLANVGSFIRLAYNGVADDVELQIEVQDIAYEITKLCEDSALAITRFATVSSDVVQGLNNCYSLLLENFESLAVKAIAGYCEQAKEMSETADGLQKKFEDEANKVIGTLKKTERARDKEDKKAKDEEEKREAYKQNQKLAEMDRVHAEEALEEAKKRGEKAEAREDEMIDKQLNQDPVIRLILRVFNVDLAKPYREDRIKQQEMKDKYNENRRKAMRDLSEATHKLAQASSAKDIALAADAALHGAVTGLKSLSVVMGQVSVFWKQMHDNCKRLAGANVRGMIEEQMDASAAERKRYWESKSFKKMAVTEYSKWLALSSICGEYQLQIQPIQHALYTSLRENPTKHQAHDNVSRLAIELKSVLAKQDQRFEAQQKLQKEQREKEEAALEDANHQ